MIIPNFIIHSFYNLIKPVGHPVHLEHILDGRWSWKDSKTLRYHFRQNSKKLSQEQNDILNRVIGKRKCDSNEEIKALKKLHSLIKLEKLYFASGFFGFVLLLVPLLAGVLSVLTIALAPIFDYVTDNSPVNRTVSFRNEYSTLKAKVEQISTLATEKPSAEIKRIVKKEVSQFFADSLKEGITNSEKTVAVISQAVANNTDQLATLVKAQDSLDGVLQKNNQILTRLQSLESLIIEKPETVVNLRLLQRDIVDLADAVSMKADNNLLNEKELRLTDNISKGVEGLSREIGMLRWVVYLLILGLIASGGWIVSIQRKRE